MTDQRTHRRRDGSNHHTPKGTHTMKARNTKKVLGTVLALGAATGAIVFGSFAAWTASTSNPGNSVATGTLTFTNDKSAAGALFSITNAKPGDTGTAQTIAVQNSGSVAASSVTLTRTGAVAPDLVPHMKLQINDTTNSTCIYPASPSPCAAWGAWSGGALDSGISLGSWAASATRNYTVNWKFEDNADPLTQGKTANFALGWAATS